MKNNSFCRLALTGTVLVMGLGFLETPSAQAVTFYTDSAAFDAVATTNFIEDFESFSPKHVPLSSFVSNGNTYTGVGSSPNVIVALQQTTSFAIPINSSVLTSNGEDNFKIDLGTPVEAIGFDTYLNGFGPATVQVFGTNGLLDTFAVNHASNTVGFLGMVSTDLITSVQWTAINGGAVNTGIDNIHFGDIIDPETVPEPTSILSLLVLGALGSRSLLKHRSQE